MKDILEALRPKQWAKNIALFAGVIFSQNFFDPLKLAKVLGAFLVFCAAASSVYLVNDCMDVEQDRRHPRKKLRPVASGRLRPVAAMGVAMALAVWSLAAGLVLNRNFFVVITFYLVLETLYSLRLKNVVILDLFCIASGFLLRVLAGALVIEVPISSWLLICTIFLSLFLALGKRRAEIVLLEHEAVGHRQVLCEYSLSFIDQMITIVTSSTVLSYVLYTLSPETVAKFHTKNLLYTCGFVLYGVFRYLYLIYFKKDGDAPEKILFSDRPLLANLVLYIVSVLVIIY